jgi:hypothetical protein
VRRRRRKGGARPPLPQCWRGCGSSSFPRRGLQLLPQRKGGARPPLPRYRRGFGSSSSSLARPAPSPPARRRSYPCSFSPAQSQPDLRVAARSVLRAAAAPSHADPDEVVVAQISLSPCVCARLTHSLRWWWRPPTVVVAKVVVRQCAWWWQPGGGVQRRPQGGDRGAPPAAYFCFEKISLPRAICARGTHVPRGCDWALAKSPSPVEL